MGFRKITKQACYGKSSSWYWARTVSGKGLCMQREYPKVRVDYIVGPDSTRQEEVEKRKGKSCGSAGADPAKPASSTTRQKRKRRPLPEHLPRETHTHMPAALIAPTIG